MHRIAGFGSESVHVSYTRLVESRSVASVQARHLRGCAAFSARWTPIERTGPVSGCTCQPTFYLAIHHGSRLVREKVGKNRRAAERLRDKRSVEVDEGAYRPLRRVVLMLSKSPQSSQPAGRRGVGSGPGSRFGKLRGRRRPRLPARSGATSAFEALRWHAARGYAGLPNSGDARYPEPGLPPYERAGTLGRTPPSAPTEGSSRHVRHDHSARCSSARPHRPCPRPGLVHR